MSLSAPDDLLCVEGYQFVFDGVSVDVGLDSLSTNFTIDKRLGLEYLNQEIFTLNAERRRGLRSCKFSLTSMCTVDVRVATVSSKFVICVYILVPFFLAK